MAITVDGRKLKVIEDLGFNHSVGHHAKIVEVDGAQKMVVGGRGNWRFWVAEDKVRPLREAAAKGWPNTKP